MTSGPIETRSEYESYREAESLLLIIDENVVYIRGTHDTRVRMYHKYIPYDSGWPSMFDSSTGHRQFSSNHIEKKGENTMLDCCLCVDGS